MTEAIVIGWLLVGLLSEAAYWHITYPARIQARAEFYRESAWFLRPGLAKEAIFYAEGGDALAGVVAWPLMNYRRLRDARRAWRAGDADSGDSSMT